MVASVENVFTPCVVLVGLFFPAAVIKTAGLPILFSFQIEDKVVFVVWRGLVKRLF